MKKTLIDTLSLPAALREMSTEELKSVALELREELIEIVSQCGGHFASSLGATEISVVLHHLFNTPKDRLVWDVGHQGYIHKMLTGRRDRLATIRTKDGLSGFLRRDESEYDSFGAGHAGTSISAAVGMSMALQKSDPERYVVSVIGDGSMTAGMAFEALNHAGSLGLKNFIVVLNDNEMSISPNVGALSWLFSRTVTSRASNIARNRFKTLHQRGYVPDLVYKAIDRAEEAAKGYFSPAAVLFEAFGFRYIGPVDGHNIEDLKTAIEHAKEQDVPVLVHAHTVKGKGYGAAEEDPLKWHGVKPFDRAKGEFLKGTQSITPAPQYTNVFADTLVELAQKDSKIIGITAAMPTGTGLDKLEQKLPEQFVDVGISEQHAVTLAAGLACEGMKPVCAIYSTFLQRAFDQVIHDVCIQNLPVVFAIDRGGLVGNDGETHQGVFDTGYLRMIPNMTVMAPRDENQLRHMLFTALNLNGPVALRYPRGSGEGVALDTELKVIEAGKAEVMQAGSEVLLVSYGTTFSRAQEVAQRLTSEIGITPTLIDARFVKPLDEELLCSEITKHKLTVTIEDSSLMAGFHGAVLEMLSRHGVTPTVPVCGFGVPDEFIPHGSQSEQATMSRLDHDSIFRGIVDRLEPKRVVAFG